MHKHFCILIQTVIFFSRVQLKKKSALERLTGPKNQPTLFHISTDIHPPPCDFTDDLIFLTHNKACLNIIISDVKEHYGLMVSIWPLVEIMMAP